MPFGQITNFFLVIILVNKVFQSLGAVSNSESNSDIFRDTGRDFSKVVLFFSIGTSSVQSDCLSGSGN